MYEMGKKGDMQVCRTLDAIEQRGIEKGRQIGIEYGEHRILFLMQKLMEDGRQMELQRVLDDSDYRTKIAREYGI